MSNVIAVSGLKKSYGDLEVVKGLDLHVEEGEIVAFLGSNGAGKTTTIEILEGFRNRDDGDVSVLGQDPADAPLAWRERIGIVLQESEPVPQLTAFESVTMQAGYYQHPRNAEEILRLVGLEDSRDQRTRKLSGGQKRRLDLALALVGDPDLVFLDEPTTGFDPSARRESWGMIEALRTLGRTVLLTTHYMDEAQHLADRIVVIADGHIVANGTADQLAARVNHPTRIRWAGAEGNHSAPERMGARVVGERWEILTNDVLPTLHALTSWALDSNVALPELDVVRPNLEDTYLALIAPYEPDGEARPSGPGRSEVGT